MANKGIVSAVAGIGAGLLMTAVYVIAPFAGIRISPAMVTMMAAVAAFAVSVALITLTALSKPDDKKAKPWMRLGDLQPGQFLAFPRSGPRIVIKPDTLLKDLDLDRNEASYQKNDVMVVIKKGTGKATTFNPLVIGEILTKIAPLGGFNHLLLLNEHDEFVGYLPSWPVRTTILGNNAVLQITKYIINVLNDPVGKSATLREIGGMGLAEMVPDTILVTHALKTLSEGLFRGLVICKGKRNRKAYGVIYEDALVRATVSGLE
jgi:hypothetical protein